MSIPSEKQLRDLSPLQYDVTRNATTEPAFSGKYNDFNEIGLYVDIVTGDPLFISCDKFASNCGWPCFAKPVVQDNIIEDLDTSNGMRRIEVRSKNSDSHLGHVYDDGPKELGGVRYSINSAALRFVPIYDLDKAGYGSYRKFFHS